MAQRVIEIISSRPQMMYGPVVSYVKDYNTLSTNIHYTSCLFNSDNVYLDNKRRVVCNGQKMTVGLPMTLYDGRKTRSLPIAVSSYNTRLIVTLESGHRILMRKVNDELVIDMTLPPLFDGKARISSQIGDVCVQVYTTPNNTDRVFVGLLESQKSQFVEAVEEITQHFTETIFDIWNDDNDIHLCTQLHAITLRVANSYQRFSMNLKRSELGMQFRTVVDETVDVYGDLAITWCFQVIAFKEIDDDRSAFLSKIIHSTNFPLNACDFFNFLQQKMLSVNLLGPVDLSLELKKQFKALKTLVSDYLVKTFETNSQVQVLLKPIARFEAVLEIPSLIQKVQIPNEYVEFAHTTLPTFLNDSTLIELREFLVGMAVCYGADEFLYALPRSLTMDILPFATQERIKAINALNKITEYSEPIYKQTAADIVCSHAVLCDGGQLGISKMLYGAGCYQQAAIIATHAVSAMYVNSKSNNKRTINSGSLEDVEELVKVVSSCIRMLLDIPNATNLIVEDIMESGTFVREKLFQQMVVDDTIECVLGFRGVEEFISRNVPRLLWRVKYIQGDVSGAVREVVKYCENDGDVRSRENEVRTCLGTIGTMSMNERRKLVEVDDILRNQITVGESLVKIKTRMVENDIESVDLETLDRSIEIVFTRVR
ncbi:hypothetical protein EIN_374570, partial [Entamoeba invadens IP1]